MIELLIIGGALWLVGKVIGGNGAGNAGQENPPRSQSRHSTHSNEYHLSYDEYDDRRFAHRQTRDYYDARRNE